jgi:hypothetical protein
MHVRSCKYFPLVGKRLTFGYMEYTQRSWKVWPIYCNILYYFCKETTTILENYVTISWNIDINIFLHSLIHSFESCIHAQGRQLIQLYGVKFVAVTNSTSRCEMTSLRAIYRKPVVNSGVPEIFVFPIPYVTSVVVLLNDTYIIWFKK